MAPQLRRREFLCSAGSVLGGFLASGCARSVIQDHNFIFPADVHLQNQVINQSAVDTALDACARALAQKSNNRKSWATIIQKPPEKSWQEIKAAIKVNEVGRNLPRIAIIHKICRELHILGIPYKNIKVYGGPNDSPQLITPYNKLLAEKLPTGVIISQHDSELGGQVKVTIPEATKDDMVIRSTSCISEIAKHKNDLLINIGVNKGHWEEFGSFTLTMKNHFGTFNPKPFPGIGFNGSHGNFDYLCAINNSDILLKGSPPQQQLCVIDSIWAGSSLNPGMNGDNTPYNLLIMGVFSPVLDYVTAIKIRRDKMQCPIAGNIHELLSYFGYTQNEIEQLDIILTDLYKSPPQPVIPSSGQRFSINPEIPDERVVGCYNQDIVEPF